MGIIPELQMNKLDNCVWFEDPRKYPYVRKANYGCCTVNFKPIKKGQKCLFNKTMPNGEKIYRKSPTLLVGMTKPKKISFRYYEGVFFYLKGYDKGMPDGELGYGMGIPNGKGGYDKNLNWGPTEAVRII